MPEPIKFGLSCWNYGGSFTTGGFEASKKYNGVNNTLYGGFGIEASDNFKVGGVFDYRANAPIYSNGNFSTSAGLRIRTKAFEDIFKTENRVQLNFNQNINDNWALYETLYGRSTIDWQNGSNSETYGEFGGVKYNLPDGKGSLSVEQQFDNKNGLSVNFGGSVNLGSVKPKSQPVIDDAPTLIPYED